MPASVQFKYKFPSRPLPVHLLGADYLFFLPHIQAGIRRNGINFELCFCSASERFSAGLGTRPHGMECPLIYGLSGSIDDRKMGPKSGGEPIQKVNYESRNNLNRSAGARSCRCIADLGL